MCRMQDSHENEVGMQDQEPRPLFQTLIKHSRPFDRISKHLKVRHVIFSTLFSVFDITSHFLEISSSEINSKVC